jgi:hypothetical protein
MQIMENMESKMLKVKSLKQNNQAIDINSKVHSRKNSHVNVFYIKLINMI